MHTFSFFLHHFEKRLNGVIYRFLTRNGYDRYDPARFLDYKLEVLQMLLYCLPKFDPEQETANTAIKPIFIAVQEKGKPAQIMALYSLKDVVV